MRSFALVTVGIFAAAVLGCSDAGTPTQTTNPGVPPVDGGGAAVTSVSVTLSANALTVGQTTNATAATLDANNNPLAGHAISWQSSNASIASVNSSGQVTALAAGTANIIATSEGKTGEAALTVTVPSPASVATVTVQLSSTTINVGASATGTATLRDAANNVLTGRSITWQSSATTVATVNSSGVITGVAAGTATITAISEGKSGTAPLTVVVAPPISGNEPQLGSSNTVVFRDDFETYDGTCRSMDVSSGGPWRTASGTCGTDPNGEISSPSGTGYAGSASGVGGRSARFIWPESTQEQFVPLEAPVAGGFSGRGQAEYYSYMYRAPGFIYRTSYPRLGKKMFLLFVGDGSTGRVTINPSEFSIMQSNGVKIDSRFDRWPAGLGSEEAFLSYLTDGRWHRYTIMRLPETTTGAMDGALRVWVDGYLVIDRTNFGTFSGATTSLILAGTFNGGSSVLQTEYYDNIRVWR